MTKMKSALSTSICSDAFLLAAKARMSRRTFERRFKEATGESPLRYLIVFVFKKRNIFWKPACIPSMKSPVRSVTKTPALSGAYFKNPMDYRQQRTARSSEGQALRRETRNLLHIDYRFIPRQSCVPNAPLQSVICLQVIVAPLLDLLGGGSCLFGKISDFIGHDGKSFTCFSGTGSPDGGV